MHGFGGTGPVDCGVQYSDWPVFMTELPSVNKHVRPAVLLALYAFVSLDHTSLSAGQP